MSDSHIGRAVTRRQFNETWIVVVDHGEEIMVVSDEPAYNHPWPEDDYGPDDPDDMQTAAAVWLRVGHQGGLVDEGWEWL